MYGLQCLNETETVHLPASTLASDGSRNDDRACDGLKLCSTHDDYDTSRIHNRKSDDDVMCASLLLADVTNNTR